MIPPVNWLPGLNSPTGAKTGALSKSRRRVFRNWSTLTEERMQIGKKQEFSYSKRYLCRVIPSETRDLPKLCQVTLARSLVSLGTTRALLMGSLFYIERAQPVFKPATSLKSPCISHYKVPQSFFCHYSLHSNHLQIFSEHPP